MRWIETVGHGARQWLERVIPQRCAACDGDDAVAGAVFCTGCRELAEETVPRRLQDSVHAHAAYAYRDPVSGAVRRFKYQNRPELARRFARSIASAACSDHGFVPTTESILVPVPLHPARLAQRGYNQAALLTTHLAKILRCRTSLRALERSRHTPRQATLAREERFANLKRQITARHPLRGDVILVDDVLTTGATAQACLEALRETGANPTAMLCIAIKE